MADDFMLAVEVNPLTFLEIDEPWATLSPKEVTAETILAFLTTPDLAHDIPDMVKRYREISVESPRLLAVPAEARIMEKLVWPLRQAKASYIVGNYLGTIALCGIVSEMVAILLFETANIAMNGVPTNEETQKALYGSTFERLNQDRRIRVLRCYGQITDEQEEALQDIRDVRNKYLHLWSKPYDSLAQDAVRAFLSVMRVVVAIVGNGVASGGKLTMTNAMQGYLGKVGGGGVVRPIPPPGSVELPRPAADFAPKTPPKADPDAGPSSPASGA